MQRSQSKNPRAIANAPSYSTYRLQHPLLKWRHLWKN
jgi:hypothetical protein